MTDYYCAYCEEELEIHRSLVSIKDGDKIVFVHSFCVPFMSGGIGLSEIEKKCGVEIVGRVEIGSYGTKFIYKFGTNILHNEHGPAVEWDDGHKEWFVDNKRHRTDGPAAEWADGTKQWYVNGKRHRTDGPAIEWADGSKSWYVDGKRLTEQEFYERTKNK